MTMTRYLFDAGPEGADLTTTNTGAQQISKGTGATATFAAVTASAGGFGAKFSANNALSIARLLGDVAAAQYAFSGVITTPDVAQASGEYTALSVRHSSGVILRLRIDSVGRVFVTDSVSTYTPTAAAAFVVAWATRYRVEIVLTAGSTTAGAYTVRFYKSDGSVLGTISSTNANLTANQVVGVDVGNHGTVATQQSVGWDTVQLDSGRTTEIGAYVAGANNPPTVSAGSNQSIASGQTVTLTGTATDTDGSIVSRQWYALAFPGATAPTINNSSAAVATATLTTPGMYGFRFVATDNSGATGEGVVKVFVPAATAVPSYVTENSGPFSTNASDPARALADSDTTTYIESPTSASTEKTLTVRLAPLVPLSPATIELTGAQLVGSGGLTTKVRLLEGTTVRKEWTPTVTSTSQTLSLTLSAAECATIGSWSELDLQFAVVAS